MRSKIMTKKMKEPSDKKGSIFEQMKRGFQLNKLPIDLENSDGETPGLSSELKVQNVPSALVAIYAARKGKICIFALHYDLDEYESYAVRYLLFPGLYQQFKTIEAYHIPEKQFIGCGAILSVKSTSLDRRHFLRVLKELVKTSSLISSFVRRLRDRHKRRLKNKGRKRGAGGRKE